MKRHRFDALSFVFGAIFVVLAMVVIASGTGIDYISSFIALGQWLLAAVIAIAGLAILGSTISGMRSKPHEDLDQDHC